MKSPLFPSLLVSVALLATTIVPAGAVTVLVDFGQSDATGNWNGISDAVAGSVADAIDDTGAPTGIGIAITSRFNGTNSSGTTDLSAPYPSFATDDSFFGNADAPFGSPGQIVSATIVVTGLTIGLPYDFTFYGSRTGVTDNRDTLYTLTGTNSGFADLDAGNNIVNTAPVSGILPDGAGNISLVVSEGDDNTNSFGFFYLGAVQIDFTPVPEPSAAALLAVATLTALRRRRAPADRIPSHG